MSYNNIPPNIKETLNNLIINNKKTTYWTSDIEIRSIKYFLNKQYEICSYVLNELETNSRKKTDWAWYIFPTQRIGNSDPLNTYLSEETAEMFLQVAPKEWQLCLEKIIELTEKNSNKLLTVLPKIDILRVNEFIIFWENIPKPGSFLRWFTIVLYKLKLFIIENDEIQEYLQTKFNEADIEAILQNGPNDRHKSSEENERRKKEAEKQKQIQRQTFKAQLQAQKVKRNEVVPLLKKELQILIRAKEQDDKIQEYVEDTHLQRQKQAQLQIEAQTHRHSQTHQQTHRHSQTHQQAQIQTHQQAQIQLQQQTQTHRHTQTHQQAQIQTQQQQAQIHQHTQIQTQRQKEIIEKIQQLIKNKEVQNYQYLIELKQILAKKQ